MATLKHMIEEFVGVTGVPRSTVGNNARRLSEADLVTRGPRGHGVPNIPARNVANMVLSTLIQGDGYETVSARIASRVKEVGSLRSSVAYSIFYGDSQADMDDAIPIFKGQSVAQDLTDLLVTAADPHIAKRLNQMIEAIGVGFSGPSISVWVNLRHGASAFSEEVSTKTSCRTAFQDRRLTITKGEPTGLVRESSMTWKALKHLIEVGAEANPDWGAA